MSGRTCRGRQAGALRKRLLAGQIIFKAFFPMDQAGQTCDDDFGRTEFVKPLTKLRKLRFIPEAVFPGRIRQKACLRDIGRNDVCQRNQAAQLLTVFWCDRAIGLSVIAHDGIDENCLAASAFLVGKKGRNRQNLFCLS